MSAFFTSATTGSGPNNEAPKTVTTIDLLSSRGRWFLLLRFCGGRSIAGGAWVATGAKRIVERRLARTRPLRTKRVAQRLLSTHSGRRPKAVQQQPVTSRREAARRACLRASVSVMFLGWICRISGVELTLAGLSKSRASAAGAGCSRASWPLRTLGLFVGNRLEVFRSREAETYETAACPEQSRRVQLRRVGAPGGVDFSRCLRHMPAVRGEGLVLSPRFSF